jgi:hypothetical protein
VVALDDEARWLFDEAASADQAGKRVEEPKPRLVGLPTAAQEELEPPAWAGPGHPTMPVPMPVASPAPVAAKPVAAVDDSPSWDDILFGHRPNDQ